MRVTDISDVTPKTDVTPAVAGGHPQNVQGVTPNLERGHPQNGGINQKEPEENQKEPVSSMCTSSEPNVEITIEAPAPAPQKRKAAPRRKPATPCPFDADASIPDEYKAIAEKVGIGNPQQVFSAFVNHALATDRRLTVWPAGFRTWCLNEIKWHPDQKPKITPQSQKTAKDYEWI